MLPAGHSAGGLPHVSGWPGERGLAGLAHELGFADHELGFADHAHLTRTIRAVTGHTPTACRGLL